MSDSEVREVLMKYNWRNLDSGFEKGGKLDFKSPPIFDQAGRAVEKWMGLVLKALIVQHHINT